MDSNKINMVEVCGESCSLWQGRRVSYGLGCYGPEKSTCGGLGIASLKVFLFVFSKMKNYTLACCAGPIYFQEVLCEMRLRGSTPKGA